MKYRSLIIFIAGVSCLSGCGFPPIGSTQTDTVPVESPVAPDPAESPNDSLDSEGEAGLPVAIALPQFDDSPNILLDGTLGALAFIDGASSSSQDGGDIVAWEWSVDSRRVAGGSQVSIGDFPVGVTTVTLVVTDESGGQGATEIDVINPGFRIGLWQGLTDQGYPVEFRINDNMTLVGIIFGYEFDGRNLLNSTPCSFIEPQENCGSCVASTERCTFSLTWGAGDEFAAAGICTENGSPPFEQASGTAAAAPVSNCDGMTDRISWSASWVSK